jgi:hypothetical protein
MISTEVSSIYRRDTSPAIAVTIVAIVAASMAIVT